MPKYPETDERKFWRHINGVTWIGYHFSDTKDENKALAKYLRSKGVPVRAITIPETHGMNYGMQAPERYLLYVPKDLRSSHNIAGKIAEFYKRKD